MVKDLAILRRSLPSKMLSRIVIAFGLLELMEERRPRFGELLRLPEVRC